MARVGPPGGGAVPSGLAPSLLTLRFPGKWEAAFYDDYFDNSLLLMRIACLSLAFVAVLYGLAIRSMLGGSRGLGGLETALAMVAAALLGVFGLTFTSLFRRVMRPVLSAVSVAFMGAFVATVVVLKGPPELATAVLVALVVGTLCAFHLLRIGFVHALAVTAVGTGLWSFAALTTGLTSPTLALMVVDVKS